MEMMKIAFGSAQQKTGGDGKSGRAFTIIVVKVSVQIGGNEKIYSVVIMIMVAWSQYCSVEGKVLLDVWVW